jgi:uncharacterized protein (DUF488 family)
VEIYSIGFTQKTAEQFFGLLKNAGIRRLVDVRLNNVSQLAGFSKREDLQYFLREICCAEYRHEPLLAPTKEILDDYKKAKGDWPTFQRRFLKLMAQRQIEAKLSIKDFDVPTVLLCSEPTADHCHRRFVLEYLQKKWKIVEIRHL